MTVANNGSCSSGSGGDSDVLYYWGESEADAIHLSPLQSVAVRALLALVPSTQTSFPGTTTSGGGGASTSSGGPGPMVVTVGGASFAVTSADSETVASTSTATTPSTTSLPYTGFDLVPFAPGGSAVTAAGIGLVVAARRRRRHYVIHRLTTEPMTG